jgi:hypothetical protein
MTARPSRACIFAATARITTSVLPPAGNETTNVMVPAGNSAAAAFARHGIHAALNSDAASKDRRVSIMSSRVPRFSRGGSCS